MSPNETRANPLLEMRRDALQPDPWVRALAIRMRARPRHHPPVLVLIAAAMVLGWLLIQGVLAFADGRLGETPINHERAAIEHCRVVAAPQTAEFSDCVLRYVER